MNNKELILDLKKLFSLLNKRNKNWLIFLFVVMFFSSIIQTITISVIPLFVSLLQDSVAIENIKLFKLVEEFINIDIYLDLKETAILFVSLYLLSLLVSFFMTYIESKTTRDFVSQISTRLYSSYLVAPYEFHLKNNSAKIIRNVDQEVKRCTTAYLGFVRLIMNVLLLISMSTLLLYYEPFVSSIVITLNLLLGGLFIVFTRKLARKWGRKVQKQQGRMLTIINHSLGGLKDTKVLGKEKQFYSLFTASINKLLGVQFYNTLINATLQPALKIIGLFSAIMVCYFLYLDGRSVESIISTLSLFGGALSRIIPAVSGCAQALKQLYFRSIAARVISDDIRKIRGEDYTKEFSFSERRTEKMAFDDKILIDNVSYSYPNETKKAIEFLSLEIKKYQMVGIVGRTGSGKSTLIDLLLGILKPDSGSINIDNKNIFGRLSDWQNIIGFVSQSTFILDDSVLANIAFGIPPEKVDLKMLEDVATKAHVLDVINNLPQGFNTKLGEHGVRLSGGERQRIALARALYTKPKILIVDEGTSSLDTKTEKIIIDNLNELRDEYTIIMVAHRISTVVDCDEIFLIKDGAVESSGTYQELLDISEEFRSLAIAGVNHDK